MTNYRIQDDLYQYVNHEWLEKAVIPDDKPRTGGFTSLATEVEELMIRDMNRMCSENKYPNELVERACKLYSIIKDVKRRKRDGIKPALKFMKKIDKITNVTSFNRNLKYLYEEGFPLPFQLDVSVDMKDAEHYALYLQGPSPILPDVTYYKEEMKAQKEQLLAIWKNMVSELLTKTKLTQEQQEQYIEDALAFDECVAKLVKSNEEWSEYAEMYNPTKLSKVCSSLKPIKLKKLILDEFGFLPEKIIVSDPRWLKGFAESFTEESFSKYIHWAYIQELLDSGRLLSEELREITSKYQRALSGVACMPNPEKFAYQAAAIHFFSEPLGLYYGETYFGQAAKQDVIDMVMQIIATYKKRVANSDILSDETKKKAVLKLDTMTVKMGYPDKCDAIYSKLVFDETASLYDIGKTLERIKRLDNLSNLTKEVDRTKWLMPGNMVNACYDPSANDITFPAAILQAPFYSIKQTRSQNLGGIGAVIGHEISHAFDNNGAKFDEKGNLNNWWTKEDFKKFKKKTQAMIKQFDGIELPWGKVNGSFIVSENIADNGGIASTLDIMSTMPDANYKEYFENWARIWCMKGREEYLKLLLAVDVHGPTVLRANMPPRNFPEWYETYGVTKKDKMYIAPNKRIIIW